MGHGRRGAHGREPAGAADAVQQRPVGFGLQAELLGDQEVEARVAGVGTCHGHDVGDVVGFVAGLAQGFLACLHGQVDACFAEESVQFGD